MSAEPSTSTGAPSHPAKPPWIDGWTQPARQSRPSGHVNEFSMTNVHTEQGELLSSEQPVPRKYKNFKNTLKGLRHRPSLKTTLF